MDRGFISAYMVTDATRMEAVYEKPAIVITDEKVSSMQQFLPMLEKLAQSGKKDLVLIAEDVEGEVQATLILNKLKGVFNTVAVKAPSFGDRRKEVLQDLAVLTGATVISQEQGVTFEDADLSVVGSARKVIVTKDETTIIEGAGSSKDVAERVKQIHAQAEVATSEYDKENYEKRAAALGGKVAVIKVGGISEVEIEEAKFRVDDAVAATKAALDEGIVAGGGVTLVDLSKQLKADGNDGIAAGRQVLKTALLQPFYQLMNNAGINPDVKLDAIKTAKSGMGFNVNDPENLVDLKKAGIVDPARVTKEAIMNAVSIAATALTMGALVVDIPEKEAPAPTGGGMPGMGMM